MRRAVLRSILIACAFVPATLSLAAPPVQPAFVQAVEFPYYLYPRSLWDRELVWLKTLGIDTVEFAVPWNWHQLQPNEFDFNGRTSPRRDLIGFIRLLRRLNLHAWIRPLPPVDGWVNGGTPTGADARAQRTWLHELGRLLAPQTVSHGGPIAYVEGAALGIDAGAPPGPVSTVAATNTDALGISRRTIAPARGSLLWTGVEDAVYPAGWEAGAGPLLRHGAVGLAGDEKPAAAALRRDAALLRSWGPLLPALQPTAPPKVPSGKLPEGVTAVEMVSAPASAVSITNAGKQPFRDDLRVFDPSANRTLLIPGVQVGPGESLWLPVDVSIGPKGLCRDCSNFSGAERIVYATAELLAIEFENGILAMEFAAPHTGEAILQLARQPVGPFLAAGKPTEFDWDDKTFRARLKIPAGTGAAHRVRIGIAIEEPETSAFFNEAHRLVIGFDNLVSTTYSSEQVAKRSRLRLPEGYGAAATTKSPNEIDYQVSVPADALHGDWANLALEADGMPLGRARVQIFRPASIRFPQTITLHFGDTELTPDPPVVVIDPKAGTNIEVAIRNNHPGIQTFHLEAAGQGLEFLPPKTETSIAGATDRSVNLRVFGDGGAGIRDWRLRVSGGATLDLSLRVLQLPRNQSIAWTADLDGDGSPEWVLESPHARAIFTAEDGGRWLEFTWKDTDTNFLPETGLFGRPGGVEVRVNGSALEFTAKDWRRTVRLSGNVLSVEQNQPIADGGLAGAKRGNVTLKVTLPAPNQAVYTLEQ
jgi:Glycosyl hydrolases family 35